MNKFKLEVGIKNIIALKLYKEHGFNIKLTMKDTYLMILDI